MIEGLKTLWNERRLDEAWVEYRRLMAPGEAGPEGHLLGAFIAQARDDFLAARGAIERAAAEHPTGNLLGKVRFNHGTILLRLGDAQGAIAQFTAWLDGVAAYPEMIPFVAGPAYYNRGLAHRQIRNYAAGIADYEAALRIFRDEGKPTPICHTLFNLAWAAGTMGDWLKASHALMQGRALRLTDEQCWHYRLGDALLATLQPDGDLTQAAQICAEILDDESDEIPLDVRAHACWLSAKISLKCGQGDAAERMVRQSLLWGAAAQNENRCLYDAADLLHEVMTLRMPMTHTEGKEC